MYSIITLRRDLESVGAKSRKNNFVWEQDHDDVHEELKNKFHNGKRRRNHLNDLTEYCWIAYKKGLMSKGPMLIGRSGDLWRKDILDRFGLDKNDYLWKEGAPGNILMMDKWAPLLNDAWVLGGIHRHADFHLMSPQAPENLWNYQYNYHVVTAREILGLMKFGYKRTASGKSVIFKCEDTLSADSANLASYDFLMKKEAGLNEVSINKLINEPIYGFNAQVNTFDYSTLSSLLNQGKTFDSQ